MEKYPLGRYFYKVSRLSEYALLSFHATSFILIILMRAFGLLQFWFGIYTKTTANSILLQKKTSSSLTEKNVTIQSNKAQKVGQKR